MRKHLRRSVFVLALALALAACKAGPPAIAELKMSKTKDAAQATNAFDARDTLYANAKIDNAPKGGKVIGRLVVVNVEGQQPGPIPSLETSLDLGTINNTADFTFTPPTAGWPNGEYSLEVILQDETGAEKDKKSVAFATSGNAPAAAEAPADATTTDTAAEGTDTAAEGDSTSTQ